MEIQIISTDFDGTLVTDRPGLAPGLVEALDEHVRRGAFWAINTGRSLWHIVEGLREHRFPFSPHYVLTNEREIFRRSADHRDHDGWEDFGAWNERCALEHDEAFERSGGFFEEIRTYASGNRRVQIIEDGPIPEGLVADSERAMDEVIEYIEATRRDYPLLGYQRNTVYLRFCHINYHKGSALTELARLLDIPRDRIFAVGDNHNDLPMLDGVSAAMVACPVNAIREVKETVRAADGYIARHRAGAGVVEALAHFDARSAAHPSHPL